MKHLLSIVVPIYNAEKYLRPLVDSLIKQTFANLEIILVDDGSSDSSPAIIDEYSALDRRIVPVHKENGGCSSARNMGIEIANGDLLALIDADDVLDLDMFEILINNLDSTESDISCCSYKSEKKDGFIPLHKQYFVPEAIVLEGQSQIYDSITRDKLSIEGLVWNKVYRSDVVNKHHFRDDVAIVDDAIWTWEICKNIKRACYVDLQMYHYRIIPSSITRNSKIDKYWKAVYACEIMMNDSVNMVPESIYSRAVVQYIRWNRALFKVLIKQKDKHIVKSGYAIIRKNLNSVRKYIKYDRFKGRLLTNSIRHNFFFAKILYSIFS